MASVLIISKEGEGLDIASRLVQEGHLVKCYVSKWKGPWPVQRPTRVSQLAMLDQYDVVLNCAKNMGEACDGIKETRPVIGGGVFNDSLDGIHDYQKEVVDTLLKGVTWNPFYECEDSIRILTEGWFDGKKFKEVFFHSFYKNRLMDGGIGPLTPCMGTVSWPTQGDEMTSRIFEPLKPLLERVNFLGPISFEACVTKDELIIIDFNTHLLYDHTQGISELFRKGIFDFLLDVTNEEGSVEVRNDYAMSVRLTVPPYPFRTEDMIVEKYLDYPKEAQRHIFERPQVSNDGVVGCVTARSDNVREAQRRVYRTINNIVVNKSVQYRHDIGSKIEEWIGDLKMWGWLDV